MIDLRETLSEFSYGYGVTREAEQLLIDIGLKPTPFLPSLVHEAKLGFDVKFESPGRVLMLQFKLGQEMERFRNANYSKPNLKTPFWRYHLDTGAGQFRHLVINERLGAEVYYVSPQFSNWQQYEEAYLAQTVLDRSTLVRPQEIRRATVRAKGWHQVVYDDANYYVCSDPHRIEAIKPKDMARKLLAKIKENPMALEKSIERLAGSRRLTAGQPQRQQLLQDTEREVDRGAALLGLSAWSQGAQLIFVTLE